jgi:hypothetical protein
MIDGLVVLTLLSVAAVLTCFRFAGCILPAYTVGDDDEIPDPPADYGDVVKNESSLVAYWRLNEQDPNDPAKDDKDAHDGAYLTEDLMAGNQSPETSHPPILQPGQPGLVDTAPGTSVRVNGGYVSVPFSADLNPAADQQFSVEAWVHPEWSGGETDLFRCVVASRQDTGANKHGYILYAGPILDPVSFGTTDATMHWQAWVGDGTTWRMLVGPKVDVGLTAYLLLTYDGGAHTLTLDAMSAATDMDTYEQSVLTGTDYSPVPAAAMNPLYIGMGMGAPEVAPPGNPKMYPFLGTLQEIAFYSAALTKAQAGQHFMAAGGV